MGEKEKIKVKYLYKKYSLLFSANVCAISQKTVVTGLLIRELTGLVAAYLARTVASSHDSVPTLYIYVTNYATLMCEELCNNILYAKTLDP